MARGAPRTAGFFSSAKRMSLPLGPASDSAAVRGYPIDFRVKAQIAAWPPTEVGPLSDAYVVLVQYGLGCYERWIAGEGEIWLQTALQVGRYLLLKQEPDGSWLNQRPFRHTFPLRAPWRCGMAQGEAASLLVRLHLETSEDAFAQAARLALAPLARTRAQAGACAWLQGARWPEEYPTDPPSLVLNGAIFAWWGMRDVGVGLRDPDATAEFEAGVDALAAHLHRFDTGRWSLYSLYPSPVKPVASSFYHALHITQLEAMQRFSARPEIAAVCRRWVGYLESGRHRRRALADKVLYRLVVPRNRFIGHRLPWAHY